MIRRLLIANRGEIACRIARTAHSMGIETVAVASSIETNAPHARACDFAVEIGPAAASESYLSIDRVISAARASGADSIHPGYGFLAENAEFARAVTAAGLIFVGPSAEIIEKLGSKLRAGDIASAAGINPIARFERGQVPSRFPVMVKAADGGGGKGMAIVRSAAELPAAIESAARIARQSFGSDELIIEEYLEEARHIEVQILADNHGNVVHLGERDCSIQRRHQKVIEEAPAPGLAPSVRQAMLDGAVRLAREVGYTSAGTVEMIASGERFFFLEVNTRLQVEHAVTEMVTGIDIVREQLRIAAGEPLSFDQSSVCFAGSSIEARIYAENPSAGDLPSTGTIARLSLPRGEGIRVDSGLEVGQTIGIEYDPMLAKIVAHGASRDEARARLHRALGELELAGVATNRGALRRVLANPVFVGAEHTTAFWSTHHAAITARPDPHWPAIAVTLWRLAERLATRPALRFLPAGFRLGGPSWATEAFAIAGTHLEVSYLVAVDGVHVRCESVDEFVTFSQEAGRVSIWAGNHRRCFDVEAIGGSIWTRDTDADFSFAITPRFALAGAKESSGACAAPMPGRVAAVAVSVGDAVSAGQTLLILEAMKMEHPLRAPHAGEVIELAASEGDQVEADQVLAVVRASE